MGLDMYLNRYPKIKGVSNRQLRYLGEYECMILYYRDNPSEKKSSFGKWIGDPKGSKMLPSPKIREKLIETLPMYDFNGKEVDKNSTQDTYFLEYACNIAYWRKANAIHMWFVHNVQKDVDDCGYYKVTKAVLEKLVADCKKALEKFDQHKFSELKRIMPTQSGFFFGSVEYDEYYRRQLEITIEKITAILEETDFEKYSIEYHSSW